MAPRFEKVDDEFIEEIEEMSENDNTKKSTVEYWKNVFKKWPIESNVNANLEEYECEALDQNSLAVLCRVAKRKRGRLRTGFPQSDAVGDGNIFKVKVVPKIHYPR